MDNNQKSVGIGEAVTQAVKSMDSSVLKGWVGAVGDTLSGLKRYHWILIGVWVLVYASTYIALDAISMGYHKAYGVTRDIPWGLLISTYIFFVVTSTGLCIVSSIGHVFGVESLMPIGKRAVFLSIVTIMSGFVCILLEVENPFRMMLYNMLSPNFTSNIWWMGTLYGAYLAFMMLEFALLLMGAHKIAAISGFIALVSGAAAHSNLGAIFGMLHGREYWYGPYMPIYFIVSAMMSGCAAIMLFTWAAYKINAKPMEEKMMDAMRVVGKLCVLLIVIVMFFTTWKIITGFAGGAGKVATLNAFLAGPYSINFWVFEFGLGMFIPLILILASRFKNVGMMAAASAMMIVGIFMMRYDLIFFGQVVSVFHELGVNEYPGLLSYTPSIHEMGIVAGAIGLTIITFFLGEKVFQGHETDDHH